MTVLGTYSSAALTGAPVVPEAAPDTSAEDALKARIAELEAQLEGTLTPEVEAKPKPKAATKASEVPAA